MTTDLSLQNSISLQEQAQARKKLAAKKDVDYKKYQVGATAYAPKGHLINDPLWKAPINNAKDTFQNVKNIGKGLKGEGNDHNLGMMNDLTMKAGGLAVAGYLATRRALPVQKGMEFVGFASFFASMVLWPKVFINAPIKALYGFNVDQKCVDSQGRKNNVHRDPQYFVSDLYSSEQLEAIGDKMGVDKDMDNRQGLVKEKMTKISTQANTLWMLTAGLATPIMGALISSQAEKGLNLLHQKYSTDNVDKKFNELGAKLASVTTAETKVDDTKLNEFLAASKDKSVDSKFVDTLVTMIAGDDNFKIKDHLHADLTGLMESGPVSDVSGLFGDIKAEAPGGKSVELKKEEIHAALQEKKLHQNIVIKENEESIVNTLTDLFKSKAIKSDANPNGLDLSDYDDRKALAEIEKSAKATFSTKLKAPMILTEEKNKKIAAVYQSFHSFRAKSTVLNEYIQQKIGDKEDSVMAREWSKATNAISSTLGFNDKELAAAKHSPSAARKVMEAKLTEIAKDDTKYEETVEKIAAHLEAFDKTMNQGAIEGKDFKQGVVSVTDTIYSTLGKQLFDNGFASTADYVSAHTETAAGFKKAADFAKTNGAEWNHSADEIAANIAKAEKEVFENTKKQLYPRSAANNVIESVDNSLIGAKNSLMKVLHGLDTIRRIENPKEVEKMKATLKASGRNDEYIKNNFGQITELMKYSLMDGDLGGHSVKFDVPNKEIYKDAMMFLYGMDKAHVSQKVKDVFKEKNVDIEEYSKHLPETISLDPKTESALGEAGTKKFRTYLTNLSDITANEFSRFKVEHTFISPETISAGDRRCLRETFANKTTTLKKQMMTGETLSNLTRKLAEQKSNTKYWLKLFGGIGAGVAAITLVAPLFFGKIEEPKKSQKGGSI